MRIPKLPVAAWLGLALLVLASLMHLWLEIYRGVAVAPQLKRGPDRVVQIHEVIVTAQELDRALQDAERGQRSYLITADAAQLEIYRSGAAAASTLIGKLKQLTADNPEQQRRLPVLERQVRVKLDELKRTLEVFEREGFEAARRRVLANGAAAMEGANKVLEATVATEQASLEERLARAAQFEQQGRVAALIGAVLAVAMLAFGLWLLVHGLRAMRSVQAARQQSEQRFHLFVRSVTDYAIYMLDPDGYVIEWNAGAERIKGYSAEEIVGQHVSRFYTAEDRNAGVPQRALEKAAKDGRYEAEGWRARKDGTRFFASVVIDAVHDASGKLVGFAKITRDIGERVEQQQALVQYQKMDALGQLTGGIAHDFNNLLHVIKNAAEILGRRLENVEPEIREYLAMLKRNADRAASLTQRLLAFSRRQILDPAPINPSALVLDVTTLLEQALGEGITIETVLSAGLWWISVDKTQLETAILNLAINARDAMAGKGKLTIEVSNAFLDERYAAAHAEVKSGQYLMIAVSDNGHGMTREVAARAFEPFFTTKELGRGTGLGLSQVYGFIKQSGGHAKIYSEPRDGTTVKLYLPRLFAVSQQQQPEAAVAPVTPGAEQGTILVVEDDDDVRKFTSDALGELGYRVLTARDAASALRALEARSGVNLLFTDIGLPGGVNGRELADQALRLDRTLKILFTTGYTRNAVIHHGRLDPDVDLIAKPYTQSSLRDAIKRVLGDES